MGMEFLEIFEEWADSYDQSIAGEDPEYKEVFRGYKQILLEVAERSIGHVVEFGVGTGNLTKELLESGLKVTGIEPSKSMRKIAEEKLDGKVVIYDGSFLHFPDINNIDTFVSTYAFHHLTDEEKATAIASYRNKLPKGGKIIFADTMYESQEDFHRAIQDAKKKGFYNLAEDLEREYYTTIPVLKRILEKNGFVATFKRFNDFVWLMEGIKS